MMKLRTLGLASLFSMGALASPMAAAATTDLRLTGSIQVGACDLSLEHNGSYGYGEIPYESLNSGANTTLATLPGKLGIKCAAPTLVGFQALDNRSGSVTAPDPYTMGLGFDSSANPIGYWKVNYGNTLLNGGSGTLIYSDTGGVSWIGQGANTSVPLLKYTLSFKVPSQADIPEPITHLVTDFNVTATIYPKENLNTSTSFDLDGSVTIELVYI